MEPEKMRRAIDVGAKIIELIMTDPDQITKAQSELVKLHQTGQLPALSYNERKSTRFEGAWRPFIGWVTGLGLVYQFLGAPLLTFFARLNGHNVTAPSLDIESLITLVTILLGLGVMRTKEKLKDKA